MRKIAAVLFALIATGAFAQEMDHIEHLKMMMHAMSKHGPVIPQPEGFIDPQATRTINITAQQGAFLVQGASPTAPADFAVNQGDVVTITVSVPAGDGSSVGHGILMDTYIAGGVNVGRGRSQSITFTATTLGSFAYVCTQTTCGTTAKPHVNMLGHMTVVPNANPGPTINNITPNSGTPSGGTVVTISGSNFQAGATVKFGGTAATNVNVASATSITATTPAHAEGAVDVVITNPDGQGVTLPQSFTYVGFHIISVSPNSGSTSGGTNVTIIGSGFQSGATVTFGALSATNVNVVDSNTIVATTPLGPANEQLQVDVTVTNPDNTSTTLHPGFTYSVPPLQVSAIAPNVVTPGGGTVVTITGAGFTSAVNASVTFGGVPATNVTVVNAVTLQATAPAHALGPVDVVVTMGGLSITKSGAVTYQNPRPRRRAAKH